MRKVLKTITALAMTGAMAFASIPGSALLQVESVWAAEQTVINSTSGTIKYDGTPKPLATYEVAEGHPLTYAVVDSSYTGDVPANASEILEISSGSGVITPGYSISDPTTSVQYIQATDVGTYRVFCSIDGNINNIGGITINPGDASIAFPASAPTTKKVGDANFSLAVTKTPSTADGTVAYSGGNAGIATIDSTGEVTIVGPGEATFTATVTPGTNYNYATTTITHTLTVLPNISAVSLTPATADLIIGSSPVSLAGNIIVSPNENNYKKVKWSVSGSGVKLYSDIGCTTEISSDETSTLAVYAKASESTTPGSYSVTMTSASDSLKTDTATLTVKGWPEVTATTAPTSTLPQTWGVNDEDVIRVDLGTPTVSGSTITYKPTGVIPKNNQTVTFAGAERTSGHYVAFQLNATEPEYSAGISSATLTVSGTEGDKEYQLAGVQDFVNGKTTSVVAVVRVDDAITAKQKLTYKFDFDGSGSNSAAVKSIVIDPTGLTYAEDATDLTNYTATLTGNTKVGSTLTATLTDGKNTIPAEDLVFHWFASDSTSEIFNSEDLISGATGSTYKLTSAEKGKFVGVEVYPTSSEKYTGKPTMMAWTASKVTAPSTPSDDTTPSDPTPVDPTPVDPTPVDPTPVDPTPVDPTPVDPTPGPEVPDDPSSDKTPAETPQTETEVDPSTGAETTTTTVKNTDDSITTKTETTLPDGASTETIRVDEVNGDYEQSYVEKDKDGNVVESATESQTTDAATGDVTSLTVKETTEGTTTETRTEKPNGDFEEKTTVASPEGLITESHEASKVTQSDGTIIEKTTEVKNGVTVETEKKTDATGATTQSEKTTAADGSSEQVTQETDASGAVTTISRTSVDKDGKGYTISGTMDADGNMRVNVVSDTKADELTIPDAVVDMDGKSHDVTELGEGSVPSASDITVGQNVSSVLKGAFSYSTTPKMKLTFQGPIKKGMFAKGAFQPELQKLNSTNGKKKAGNNITIFVQSKKDMKQMKKQLKKAGIPGAKVKVEK